MEPLQEEGSQITSFYRDKTILVTGSTGFIGKVLIEKLLYECPNVRRIYLLIRSERGKSPRQRLSEMIGQEPLTMRLKRELLEDKLVAIDSDLSKAGLGLGQDDLNRLVDEVSLVFHVAASVKFEAPLDVNMRHNVIATRELLDIATNFKQLACFIHVSTAYSNCQMLEIDECVYPMEIPDDPMALEVTNEMLAGRPNTYTYTKAMAENVVNQYAKRMNVVIVRPSIVMASIKEPHNGWVDTINGPVGLSVLGALGILQKIKVNSEVVFDLIPVDIVANSLIAIGWAATERSKEFNGCCVEEVFDENGNELAKTGNKSVREDEMRQRGKITNRNHETNTKTTTTNNNNNSNNNNCNHSDNNHEHQTTKTKVFNLTTGNENPCSFYQYFKYGRAEALRKPSVRVLRPLMTIPKQKGMSSFQYAVHKVFSHLLFAYLVDLLLGMFSQKKMVVKAVKRMHHANEIFDYFCSNQWAFRTDNVKRVRQLMSAEDRQHFNCDVRSIDWRRFAQVTWYGCRRFILKESDETVEYAKRRYAIMCLVYYAIKLILLLALTLSVSLMISSRPTQWALLAPVYTVVYLL